MNLKNSYLALWMYEEQTRYFVIFHTYLFVLIYIEDVYIGASFSLLFLFFIIYSSNTYWSRMRRCLVKIICGTIESHFNRNELSGQWELDSDHNIRVCVCESTDRFRKN